MFVGHVWQIISFRFYGVPHTVDCSWPLSAAYQQLLESKLRTEIRIDALFKMISVLMKWLEIKLY